MCQTCDKECALWSTSMVPSFWFSLASPCLTFYSFLENSILAELSFRFDFRSVLVALISPWQVNGQTSGGGFWVALQLWNGSTDYENWQTSILGPAAQRGLCDGGFVNGETVPEMGSYTWFSLSSWRRFRQWGDSSRYGELYVIFTRLGGRQMARTDFGLNCLLSRQFLTCVSIGEVLVFV
jgi:hypothetical protein